MNAIIQVVNNRLPQLSASLAPFAAEAINAGVLAAIETADTVTPVDTGALRSNKTIGMASAGDLQGEVAWNQEYAAPQNFGTSRGVAAKHFAEQGAQAGETAINAHLGSWV